MPGKRSRGLARLAWGLAAYATLQSVLLAVMWVEPSVRDPEYGRRLAFLRDSQRNHPDRPLVVLLGSSRVSVNVDTDTMAARHPTGPLVFNYGINGSGPVAELVTLHRLFAAGVRPQWVVVETHFWMYRRLPPVPPQEHPRYGWSDVDVLKRHSDTPEVLERYRLSSLVAPWYAHRLHLQAEWAPDLLPEATRSIANDWNTLTPWGFLALPLLDVADADRPNNLLRVAGTRTEILARSEQGAITEHSSAAFREMKALCDRHGCRMALLHTPDIYMWDYSEPARAGIEAELRELTASLDLPVLDFRWWGEVADCYDGVHLTQEGAGRFTADFELHLFRLVGDPAGRAGVVWSPPPKLKWGTGFSVEETSDNLGWRRFRWSAPESTLTVTSRAATTRRVRVSFSPQSFAAGPCNLAIDWPGKSETLTINAGPTPVSRMIDLPPGTSTVRFRCDGAPLVHPVRTVAFALHEFTLTPVEEGG